VYANWENGVGNLLGDKPEGTGYVPVRGFGEGNVGALGGTGGGGFTRLLTDDETESATEGNQGENPPALPIPSNESSSPALNNAIKEYESAVEEGVRGLAHRAISPKQMEQLLEGLEGIEIYRTDEFIVVKANGLSFVFEKKFNQSRSEPRPYWVLQEILRTEGFSSTAIVEHAKNERNLKSVIGQEKVLTFALHALPSGTLLDKLANETDENVYYVALTTAGDLTLIGGLYFKATSRLGKAVLMADVAVNGVGAGAAAYQYANSEEGRAAHAGEFVLRLAALGLGANSLRLSSAQAKIARASSEAQALEKVAGNAPKTAELIGEVGTFSKAIGGTLSRNKITSIAAKLENQHGTKIIFHSPVAKAEGNHFNPFTNEIHLQGGITKQRRGLFYEEVQHAFDHHAGLYDDYYAGKISNRQLHAITAQQIIDNPILELSDDAISALRKIAEEWAK
jgi:hypothetical protein